MCMSVCVYGCMCVYLYKFWLAALCVQLKYPFIIGCLIKIALNV